MQFNTLKPSVIVWLHVLQMFSARAPECPNVRN